MDSGEVTQERLDHRNRKQDTIDAIQRIRKDIETQYSKDEDGDDSSLESLQQELGHSKHMLESLRLQADRFVVQSGDGTTTSSRMLIEITERGEITIFQTMQTKEPYIPEHISAAYAHCNVEMVRTLTGTEEPTGHSSERSFDSDNVTFEIQFTDRVRFIDELQAVKQMPMPSPTKRASLNRTRSLSLSFTRFKDVASPFIKSTLAIPVSFLSPSSPSLASTSSGPAPTSYVSFATLQSSPSPSSGPPPSAQSPAPSSLDIDSFETIPLSSDSPSSLSLDDPRKDTCVMLEWHGGTAHSFITSEAVELTEVLGAFMNRYKRSRVVHVIRLKELFEMKKETYDGSLPGHEDLLFGFWRAIHPGDPLEERKSQKWKSVGFQGVDPATDFRGMGVLGLYNLTYYARTYPDRVREILAAKREYPFAATGINVTNLLPQMLGLTQATCAQPPSSPSWDTPLLRFFSTATMSVSPHHHLERVAPSREPTAETDQTINSTQTILPPITHEHCFEEVYCIIFDVLDAVWVKMNAGYMDFPRVMATVRSSIEQVASTRPNGWHEFRNRIAQLIIAHTLSEDSASTRI
eukprot:TRINITY_DN4958_c0_g1_i2.p1 TRINITY_DN4958_c0_g1~~TRINITY_DN4958_c0_g1_i2.p1  ORF type:complete len:578 (+),score=133.29 TRINITY_DN4958_c0_g1_i2:26-1759(+)